MTNGEQDGTSTGGNQPKVGVVIPYFQRKPGVLRQAVNAVLRQQGFSNYRIVIVDDGAPWPATEELKGLLDDNRRLTVLTQRNAGPGAARNAGLENVDPDTEYVAFLDSDDVWAERHLENAVAGLQRGYDFYFADYCLPDDTSETAFMRTIDLSEHDLLDEKRGLYAYRGDMMDQIIVGWSVIGTSTAVYRFSKYPKLRFREEFYNGQDRLFWIDFSRLSDKFVMSTRLECRYGRGVNIYSGAGWGSDRSLERLRNELFLWRSVGEMFPLTPVQRAHNKRRIQRLREATVRDLLHRFKIRKEVRKDVLRDLFRIDPFFWAHVLPISARVAWERMRRR
jgi:succinoglycan biosynthesis protein ExoW